MGAWSHESFGNDDACDWIAQLEERNDFSLVASTLDNVIKVGADYLEAQDACEAIAAAEVVARAQGNGGTHDKLPQDVEAWVQRVNIKPSASLVDTARRALDRILTRPSELMELWEESDESDAWRASVEELRMRVGT